jgi:hypothetical protein
MHDAPHAQIESSVQMRYQTATKQNKMSEAEKVLSAYLIYKKYQKVKITKIT